MMTKKQFARYLITVETKKNGGVEPTIYESSTMAIAKEILGLLTNKTDIDYAASRGGNFVMFVDEHKEVHQLTYRDIIDLLPEYNGDVETTETIDNIVEKKIKTPLDVSVIPNNMGINLCAVKSMTWRKLPDGQLTELKINFMPNLNTNCPDNVDIANMVGVNSCIMLL